MFVSGWMKNLGEIRYKFVWASSHHGKIKNNPASLAPYILKYKSAAGNSG